MATDEIATASNDGHRETGEDAAKPVRSSTITKDKAGFFHIYKSGQGYWTRMGTAGGAAVVGLLTASFIYTDLPPRFDFLADHRGLALSIAGGFFVAFALLVWWYMNRQTSGEFLISTDSEMKKVNWTSRAELIGSTKVVILFMFLIAFLLFAIDIIFGYLFHFMGILQNKPF